jgi:uncharacterized integral membrane protein
MAQSIRDAIAPVFLMSGVATILSVTTSRFSRIVDRYRTLMNATPMTEAIKAELVIMYRRSRVIHRSIEACSVCALLICVVIAIMFVSSELNFAPSHTIAFLFVVAMGALIVGLLLFLYEVHLATGTLSVLGKTHAEKAQYEIDLDY